MTVGRIIAALVAVALFAGVAWRRRRLGGERVVLALVAATALAVYASGLLGRLPNPEHVIRDVAASLGSWTYVLVGGMAFLETGAGVGLVAPGEFTVILGGVIAGQGTIHIVPLIGIVWGCAILGDSTSFLIGQRLGRGFVMRHGPKVKLTQERFEQVEAYFRRHGGKTILIGRFIGLVRALAPFIAGSSGMSYGRFLPYSVIGTGLWAATFSILGYVFWRSFSQVTSIAGQASVAFGIVVAVIAGGVVAYRRLRHEEERERLRRWVERQAERPALRPLAAVLRPVWRRAVQPAWRAALPRLRFVANRLTPGNLGIEFTTALAVAASGLYLFALYAWIIENGTRATGTDRAAFDVVDDLRTERAVDVAKIVTDLGALPVVAACVAAACILLAIRRRPLELGALLLGLAVLVVSVQLAKSGIDRPRPAGSLVHTDGQSYPSGHAAYATVYVALAVVASRVLPNLASRAAFVLAAIAVAAAVGLTRVYLHAHYWSDVVGGWGLGAGVLGLTAAIALVISYIRQNERVPDSSPHDAR